MINKINNLKLGEFYFILFVPWLFFSIFLENIIYLSRKYKVFQTYNKIIYLKFMQYLISSFNKLKETYYFYLKKKYRTIFLI